MVLGYHVILTTYGFWLPNDPRGSWSEFVRSWELSTHGRATTIDARRSVAAVPHDAAMRRAAKKCLEYPEVFLTGIQAREVGRAFGEYVDKSGLRIWACSILPQHVHLVIGRHRFKIERVANLLKGAASAWLARQALHPLQGIRREDGRFPPMWARGQWIVFLDSAADVRRSIRYVEDNPVKEGKRRQHWSFVAPYDETRSPTHATRSPAAPR